MKKKIIITTLALMLIFTSGLKTLALDDITPFEDEIVDPVDPTPPVEPPVEPPIDIPEEPVDPTPPVEPPIEPPIEIPEEPGTPPVDTPVYIPENAGSVPTYTQPTYTCGVNTTCLPHTGDMGAVQSLSAFGLASLILMLRKGVSKHV